MSRTMMNRAPIRSPRFNMALISEGRCWVCLNELERIVAPSGPPIDADVARQVVQTCDVDMQVSHGKVYLLAEWGVCDPCGRAYRVENNEVIERIDVRKMLGKSTETPSRDALLCPHEGCVVRADDYPEFAWTSETLPNQTLAVEYRMSLEIG